MPPFVIRDLGGVKVGLFGLLTTDTATSSKPGGNLRFVDPLLTARVLVKQMRAKGAQIIVAVTHLTMSKDKELAATGLVDVIIGGHEHERLEAMAGRTPIFKWGQDARVLGRIDLHVNTRTGKIARIGPVCPSPTPRPTSLPSPPSSPNTRAKSPPNSTNP
jgi:5'-nucleotidase